MKRLVTAAIALLGLSFLAAAPVAAECDGPVPSFREAAPSARTILVGDVIALHPSPWNGDDGRSTRFTVRVPWVLRGTTVSSVEIRDLDPNGCTSWIGARVGDRIAFALHATGSRIPHVYSTVAWVRGDPPGMTGLESISLAEVFRLARGVIPDTATEPVEPGSDPAGDHCGAVGTISPRSGPAGATFVFRTNLGSPSDLHLSRNEVEVRQAFLAGHGDVRYAIRTTRGDAGHWQARAQVRGAPVCVSEVAFTVTGPPDTSTEDLGSLPDPPPFLPVAAGLVTLLLVLLRAVGAIQSSA